ncbi:TrmH family RNA methyltransferase [Paucihalobacter sp.]|uniref:TrmH family RNA methyltransferase n=1 Tax=Paucihalobacter sp. TaxID=2850405 RepID=UPI002FE08D4C
MLSHNQIKLIRSLKQKKYRQQHGLFVVEGLKSIVEFVNAAYVIKYLFTIDSSFAKQHEGVAVTEKQLSQISYLKSPNKALAVFQIPKPKDIDFSKLIVALDDIGDPGNLGTIIRLCDWFGVQDLLCSHHTADCYNEKVVQASMGSLSRVNVSYVDLPDFLQAYPHPILGTFMDGATVYNTELPEKALVVMGNEGNGISAAVEALVTSKISIPQFGLQQPTESLNVATATAIMLNEFRRHAY